MGLDLKERVELTKWMVYISEEVGGDGGKGSGGMG